MHVRANFSLGSVFPLGLLSEVGGSEFAFRQAPPRNREIVSCRACVRAEPMLGGNASQISSDPFSLFPFVSTAFPSPSVSSKRLERAGGAIFRRHATASACLTLAHATLPFTTCFYRRSTSPTEHWIIGPVFGSKALLATRCNSAQCPTHQSQVPGPSVEHNKFHPTYHCIMIRLAQGWSVCSRI